MARETVWDALMNPDVLARCIPGCQSLEQTASDAFRAKIALVIGPVRASFDTDLTLSDVNPPTSYRLTGSGRGGAVGFGQGRADVELEEPEPGVTLLRYAAAFQVGGRLAQLGSRLVQATTKKLADEFFAALVREIDQSDGSAATAPEPAPSRTHSTIKWLLAAVVALALLGWWLVAGGLFV